MSQTSQKLHLGCGSNSFPGWINVDIDSSSADQLLDLTAPLPYQDSSVSHIFTEHFIEHITREQAVALLKECYRVLSPQGVIRISTPNLHYLVSCYCANDKAQWGNLWQPNTRCQMMNEGLRSWGHQFVYDAEELVQVINEAGFHSISFQNYRQSTDQNLISLETRPFHNELIVEAYKSLSVALEVDFSAVAQNEASWTLTNNHAQLVELSLNMAKVKAELVAQTKQLEEQSLCLQKLLTNFHSLEIQLMLAHSSWCGKIRSCFIKIWNFLLRHP